MSESSSSRAARLGLEARATEPSGLPLIQCPICKKEQILELVSKSPRNYIERVFKCPKKYIQNPLCSYYMWGDDYARYIEKKGFVRSEVVTHYLLKTQILRLEMEIERLKEEVEFIGKELGGTDQLKEEIRVLKMQLVQHKQVVEGTVKMAVRWGKIFAVLYAAIAILVVMHIFLAVVN